MRTLKLPVFTEQYRQTYSIVNIYWCGNNYPIEIIHKLRALFPKVTKVSFFLFLRMCMCTFKQTTYISFPGNTHEFHLIFRQVGDWLKRSFFEVEKNVRALKSVTRITFILFFHFQTILHLWVFLILFSATPDPVRRWKQENAKIIHTVYQLGLGENIVE